MNCRNCAAAMEPVGGRAYFRCLHCGTFEFPTTNGDGIAEVGESTDLPCPVCKANLALGSIEGHPVRFCDKCQGFLATNADFGEIVPKKRNQFADQPTIPRAFDRKELQRRLVCPQCRKRMDTHPYGAGGNAVVDTCHRCHLIWLDAGELEVIARYRPAGSLGYANNLLVAKDDGPPKEPESPFRWAWEMPEKPSDANWP